MNCFWIHTLWIPGFFFFFGFQGKDNCLDRLVSSALFILLNNFRPLLLSFLTVYCSLTPSLMPMVICLLWNCIMLMILAEIKPICISWILMIVKTNKQTNKQIPPIGYRGIRWVVMRRGEWSSFGVIDSDQLPKQRLGSVAFQLSRCAFVVNLLC